MIIYHDKQELLIGLPTGLFFNLSIMDKLGLTTIALISTRRKHNVILPLMAYIVFNNKTTKIVPREQGIKLWEALQDPTDLDDKQLAYLATIKMVYLNYRHAPVSYLQYHADTLNAMYGPSKPKPAPVAAALPYKD